MSMANRYFESGISDRDFPSHDQPEAALAKLRQEVEGRLRWLEHNLTPDLEDGGRRPGESLVERGLIEKNTFGAISEVINATNPSVHGRSVEPSTAASIVETGIRLIYQLDALIEMTGEKIERLNPQARVIYRFLELPSNRRNKIAKSYGVDVPAKGRASVVEQARQLLRRARGEGKLEDLSDEIESARSQ